MKIFALFLLFGVASAAFDQALEEAAFNLLEELEETAGQDTKRSAADELMHSELNFYDILRKIKEHVRTTIDPELLKAKIEKLFDQGSELMQQLLRTLHEKGRARLEMIIDALLENAATEGRDGRGIKDYWEKIKDYFKDLKIDLQEKYVKFGEWVKENYNKHKETSKDKMDNIRAIANEFLKHAKGISKEVAAEAGEFFRNYKDELGIVWDEIKEKVENIRKKKD